MWRQACTRISVCARGAFAADTARLMKCKPSNHSHLSKHGYSKECDHSHVGTANVKSKKERVRFKQ